MAQSAMELAYRRNIRYSNECGDFEVWESEFAGSEWGPTTSYCRIELCEIETGATWHGTSRD